MDLNSRLLDAVTDLERHLFAMYPMTGEGNNSFRFAASRAHRAGKLADRDLADPQDLRHLRNLASHSWWQGRTPGTASVSLGELYDAVHGEGVSIVAAGRPRRYVVPTHCGGGLCQTLTR